MIKIVNWNIRHGKGKDNKVDIQRVGKLLKSFNADIYTLQEIDRGLRRSDYTDQAQILSDILERPFHFTPISKVNEGEYGLATFSSLRINEKTDIALTKNVENNSAQLTRFSVKSSIFDVVNLHAPWRHTATYWKNFNKDVNFDHCILSGDFNQYPESRIIQEFKQKYNSLNEKATFQGGKILDYTFVPNKILSQEVVETNFSDHHILVTTFDLW